MQLRMSTTDFGQIAEVFSHDGFQIDPIPDPIVRHMKLDYAIETMLDIRMLFSCLTTRSHFLIDAVSVVLLWDSMDAKLTLKHRYFVQLLKEVSEEVPDFLPAVSLFNMGDMNGLRDEAQRLRIPPADKVTVAVDGRILVLEQIWHKWWRERYQQLRVSKLDDARAVDLATGQWGTVASTHSKVSGLVSVGGAATGDALISFDKPAFESYGLKQAFNAPMSPETVANYRAALDDLIQRGETLGKVRMVYWYRKPVATEDDWLAAIFHGIDMDEHLEDLQAEGQFIGIIGSTERANDNWTGPRT